MKKILALFLFLPAIASAQVTLNLADHAALLSVFALD